MADFDITAVINGHAEGLVAQPSLRSLAKCAAVARATGLRVELLAILDKPNAITEEVFAEFARVEPGLRIKVAQHGDLGFSRNTAVEEARGKWIGFLDADDIWSADWLVLAHAAAESDPRKVVWHPEVNAYFGVTPNIFLHIDMEDPAFRIADLGFTNLWTSLCFTSADLLRSVPYVGTDLKNGIGYEDWCWNVDVVNSGGIHKIVPNTAHAIRTRRVSLVKQTSAADSVPRPSDFFRKVLAATRAERSIDS
ncbi:glycosyltransferase [Paraburkholderia sp. LEh10]|uniref:glycosyltransferase family 2 protein n=1 Tax=Paraburkholderia sp. LEh10 TaxID=2821353 RepID=UPI001AE7D238|nr:glycosyltransferase [Paraburkholderia sp. LEh10]MBP0593891.1 glycosyltransferase [Paraburkholderia sp. LEh10]